MKLYISVDMEGITGLVDHTHVDSGKHNYERSRRIMTVQEKTAIALKNIDKMKPLTPPDSPLLRIEFTNYGEAEWANLMPGTELLPDSTIVQYQAKDILEAYQAMLVITELAMRTTFC
ncbi:hypothetical protein ELQ35_07470 [Peribacillus cavernae]|uniref:Uncharacterized protein n=1 Tax=Peribacillus cavernae TaxID=1674310 RepID=A0A3S0UF79_9BACI|nr:M55 family metallopeptidase [Peribacillus cavernae]MDQ0217372.1 D-aminopeptidase [Peribacillus cavernae]RUQ30178.1 hypothetical protein ELQ35_07470 [Peribacillus cavernae]